MKVIFLSFKPAPLLDLLMLAQTLEASVVSPFIWSLITHAVTKQSQPSLPSLHHFAV